MQMTAPRWLEKDQDRKRRLGDNSVNDGSIYVTGGLMSGTTSLPKFVCLC